MTKTQVILLVTAVVVVIALYQLPTAVVSNETDATIEIHDMTVTDADAIAIQSLRTQLPSLNNENLSNFADSLSRYYLRYGYLDSAVQVVERYLVTENSSLSSLKKAGSVVYAAFERSQTSEEAGYRISLAGKIYARVNQQDPEDLSAKTRLAMTLVSTENPMAGITMMREVLDVDPNFREAILNLGLLSIRSGQFDRAIQRFEKLMVMDSTDYEAQLYYGVALMEMGDPSSKEIFERIAETEGADPAIIMTAQQYLQEN